MIYKSSVDTNSRIEFVDITSEVQKTVSGSGVENGVCYVYIPHTTAGVTINENADPHVVEDINMQLTKLVPAYRGYKHAEGNSDAHIKASLLGSSVAVFVENRRLVLGAWQGIYFGEFDGPRNRNIWCRVIKA